MTFFGIFQEKLLSCVYDAFFELLSTEAFNRQCALLRVFLFPVTTTSSSDNGADNPSGESGFYLFKRHKSVEMGDRLIEEI